MSCDRAGLGPYPEHATLSEWQRVMRIGPYGPPPVSQEAMDWAAAQLPDILAAQADPDAKFKSMAEFRAGIERQRKEGL